MSSTQLSRVTNFTPKLCFWFCRFPDSRISGGVARSIYWNRRAYALPSSSQNHFLAVFPELLDNWLIPLHVSGSWNWQEDRRWQKRSITSLGLRNSGDTGKYVCKNDQHNLTVNYGLKRVSSANSFNTVVTPIAVFKSQCLALLNPKAVTWLMCSVLLTALLQKLSNSQPPSMQRPFCKNLVEIMLFWLWAAVPSTKTS